MKTQALLAVLGLASPAGAFLPVPAACSRHAASTVAVNEAAAPSARRANKARHLVMKKEPSARGKAAKAKGEADEAGDPRRQALDGVLHQIERCYGRGSILKMGDSTSMDVETSSTGMYDLLDCCCFRSNVVCGCVHCKSKLQSDMML